MTIEVDSSNLDNVITAIKLAEQSTLGKIGQTVKTDLLLGFKNEESPSGERWKPLKKSTLKARRKKGGGAKILQDTGNLKKSLNSKTSSGKVTIGYGADYAIYHQATRKILPTEHSEIDMETIQDIIFRGILK